MNLFLLLKRELVIKIIIKQNKLLKILELILNVNAKKFIENLNRLLKM